MKTRDEIQEILKREFPLLLRIEYRLEWLTDKIEEAHNYIIECDTIREKEIDEAKKAMLGYNSKTGTVCFIHSKRDFDFIQKHYDLFSEIMNFKYSFPGNYAGKNDTDVITALNYLSNKAHAKICTTGRVLKYNGTYDCSYEYSGHNDRGIVPGFFHYDEIWELCVKETCDG